MLGAANQALPRPDEPHLALWQATTTLLEQRGDGHVAALVAAGVRPVGSLVLRAAGGGIDTAAMRKRAGSEEKWVHAEEALQSRSWLDSTCDLTDKGRSAREEIEDRTDAAAASPWVALGERRSDRAAELLGQLVGRIIANQTVPEINPIGLPMPSST